MSAKSSNSMVVTLTTNQLQDLMEKTVSRAIENRLNSLQEEKFLTVNEVSEKYKVSRTTLYLWRKKGYINFCTSGGKSVLFKDSEIRKFIEAGSPKKGGE